MEINEQNFDEFVGSDQVSMIDLYAEWCQPCKLLGPVLDKIKDKRIGKVNVDNWRAISSIYSVTSIPTMLFFRNGKMLKKVVGLLKEVEIRKIFEDLQSSTTI